MNEIRERLAVVETDVKYVKIELKELNGNMKTYNKELKSLSSCVNEKLRGSLTGKEKASIRIAQWTSVGAMVVALLANLDKIVGLFMGL